MEGDVKEISTESSAEAKESAETEDFTHFDNIERVLENEEKNTKLRFLDFEKQMFMDCVFHDGLVICAKGILYDRVLLNLLKVYLDPANLILVLNSDEFEEKYYTKLLESRHVHQSSANSNEREKIYLEGGIQFISTQVLVLDLLRSKIPVELITGIIVMRAHQIIESSQESFALRLYRQKNKKGFIKAFSSSCEAFTMGYGHVEKVMRNLFVRDLFLWPRFHALIQKNLKTYEPMSIEFHMPLSTKTTLVQTHLLDLMNFIVKELKRINPSVDLEEVTVENCMTKRFQKILQAQLDTIWHQLNAKTKLLITDLKILRSLMFTAIYGDSVMFYASLKKYRSADYALNNSGWTLLNAAEQIFKLSKERVFNSQDEFDAEPCPKWKALSEILRVEIPSDIKKTIADERNEFESNRPIKILILCQDSRTCHQLNQYLLQGVERTLFWSAMKNDVAVQKLSSSYKKISGKGSVKDCMNINDVREQAAASGSTQVAEKLSLRINENEKKRKIDETKSDADQTKTSEISLGIHEEDETDDLEILRDTFVLTMTQKNNDSFSAADFDISMAENLEFEALEDDDLNVTNIVSKMEKPTVFIQSFRSDYNRMSSLSQTLEEMTPDYIVLYNVNITTIRQIEIFEARYQRHAKRRLKVFVLMHAKTVEEQSFLTSLRREKQAFELLIETKRTMVVPEYQDGKTDVLDPHKEVVQAEDDINTRQAGGQNAEIAKKEKPRIIIDSREFRSELPCLIHRRGIDVVPAMITIGDYILTPEICVERKSISDLIGSLNSGRLYNQCQQMTRFYSKSILLIEFDQNRPFHLQGRYMLSRDSDAYNAEIMQKLQLLTIHFPQLRLVWSPTPYSTAQLFEELKQNKNEPNIEQVLQTSSDMQELALVTDKYNTNLYDFLLKLPGVNLKNIHGLMRNGKNLKNLMKMTEEELGNLLGNSKDGKLLHESFHSVQKPVKKQEEQKSYKQKKFMRKN